MISVHIPQNHLPTFPTKLYIFREMHSISTNSWMAWDEPLPPHPKIINNFKVYFLHIALPLLSFSIFNIWHPRFLPGSLLSLPVLWSYCLFPMNPGSWKVTMEYFIMSRKDLSHLVNISETASKSLSLFVRSQCVYLQHL